MSTIVDKSSIGLGGRQFHVGVAPGEVSTVVLMPGDPFRVPLVAEYLDDPVDVAHKREHRTMKGTYQGREITVTSTGMGCPSTAIAVEELARVGVTSFIRVGSTGALQEGMEPGDLVISQGSFRNDGTTDAYVPKGYPAVPDLEITLELERVARERAPAHGLAVHVGLNITDDAFYAESPEWTQQMSGLGPAQRRDGVGRDVRRRAPARAAGRDDLRRLEQSRRRDERLRRVGPRAPRRRLAREHRDGARDGRPALALALARHRPHRSEERTPVGLNLHTHLEGWVRPETAAELARDGRRPGARRRLGPRPAHGPLPPT